MIPIQLLTLGHTVRVCYDLTNYAELSINSNGDLTIHKLVGGSPKIIDKTVTDETFITPPTDRPLKVYGIMERSEMLYIASKYVAKGYSQSQMRDGDDCYHLKGEEGREIKSEIAEYMEELEDIGRIAFYEKYKEFKLF